MTLIFTSLIAILSLFYILGSERRKNRAINRKKQLTCDLRAEIQEQTDEFNPDIEIIILGDPQKLKKSVRTLWVWLIARVGITPVTERSLEKKLIRVVIDEITVSDLVTVTIEWPGVPFSQAFPSTNTSQRDCDMCMRRFILMHFKHIFTVLGSMKHNPLIYASVLTAAE
jgi:hypothetical protein